MPPTTGGNGQPSGNGSHNDSDYPAEVIPPDIIGEYDSVRSTFSVRMEGGTQSGTGIRSAGGLTGNEAAASTLWNVQQMTLVDAEEPTKIANYSELVVSPNATDGYYGLLTCDVLAGHNY
jgi:hypothetical protein